MVGLVLGGALLGARVWVLIRARLTGQVEVD
jgi:hypothetical protein